MDSWLAYRVEQEGIPGFSAAVSINGRTIFSQAYGYANIESREALTDDHYFQVASQTKMLTAIAIMQLAEAGKVALDKPAATYLPWMTQHTHREFRAITVRQLLGHQAGFTRSNHSNDYWLFKRPFPTRQKLREVVLEADPAFSPGDGVKYSNLNYGLLGLLIEAVSGQTYDEYIKSKLLRVLSLPAKLDTSGPIWQAVPVGYGLSFGHRRPAIVPRLTSKSLAPAAGLYATPKLMCRFMRVFSENNQTLLSQESKHVMQRTQTRVEDGYYEGTEFGLGLMIEHVGKRRLFGHDGHAGGHVTATFFDPTDNLAVAVCGNSKDIPVTPIARGIFSTYDFFKSAPPIGSPLEVRLLNEMSTIQIVQNGKNLVAIDPDDWDPFSWYETLEPAHKNSFLITTPGSIYNQGEWLQYTLSNGKIIKARFAGMTLYPERLWADKSSEGTS